MQNPKKDKNRNPKMPESWNKTIDDLYNEIKEGKRTKIEYHEICWTYKYERSLILPSYRYPKKGDVYESKYDQQIELITDMAMRYLGGSLGTVMILNGERIKIFDNCGKKKPLKVYADPVNYHEFEKRIVRENMRNKNPIVNLFYFSVSTRALNENYILVNENSDVIKCKN